MAAPTEVRTFPLLVDPRDGTRRYFVTVDVDLIAIWSPTVAPPEPIDDLVVFANFLCGPCTNAWLLFTAPNDTTGFDVTVNDSPTTCAQEGRFFDLSLCEIVELSPGPVTFTVTPTNGTTRGIESTISVTMRS